MLRALLVLSATACVFGWEFRREIRPDDGERPPSTAVIAEKDLCLEGGVPTEQCQKKCEEFDANFEPYCYKHTRECLCRPKKASKDRLPSHVDGLAHEEVDNPSPSEPLDGAPGSSDASILRFIILFLGADEAVPEDSGPEESPPPAAVPIFGESDFLWSKERLAMALMAAVILALVVVELCIMYRKRRSARQLENVFKTSQLDDQLVKSFEKDVRNC